MNGNWTWIIAIGVIALAWLALSGNAASSDAPQGGTDLVETQTGEGQKGPEHGSPKRKDKVVLSDAEWKKKLSPEQYRILRNKGTEAAFCSPMYDNHKTGVYQCVGCGLALFKSDNKFTSGTGWPSFFQPAAKDSIWTRADNSYGMRRVEVLCARCDGHLGHVFDDGPKPTGLRYCINGEVLKFVEGKGE